MSPLPARLRFYLAVSSGRADVARFIMQDLVRRGFSNAHDWTQDLLAEDATHDDLQRAADGCVEGVRRCDVLILVLPVGHNGAFVEQGIALGKGKPVIVVSGDERLIYERPMVFLHTTGVQRFTGPTAWQDALEWLENLRDRMSLDDHEQDSRTVWG